MRATALCAVATLSLAACSSDDSGDGDESTTTTEASTDDESTTTTESDDGEGAEASELEVTGDTVDYAGATLEVTAGSMTPDEYDEELAELTLEVELRNETDEDTVSFYSQPTAVIDGEDYDLGGGGGVDIEAGKKTTQELTVQVPSDSDWDDIVLEYGQDGYVPAILPLTSAPEESELPISIEPDETLELIDGSDKPFSLVVDKVTRSLDATDTNGTVERAPEGSTFLIFEVTTTTGVDGIYVVSDYFRLEGAGEVTDPVIQISGGQEDNTLEKRTFVLVLPDDADDAVVRIGDPTKDPNYTTWDIPWDDLGGEISDGLPAGGSDDEGDEADSADEEDSSSSEG